MLGTWDRWRPSVLLRPLWPGPTPMRPMTGEL